MGPSSPSSSPPPWATPQTAQALLASIVESSEDAIVSKTLEGRITSWNRGAERLFGFTAAEAIGQPITIVIPEELRGEERAILQRLRQGERIEHYETVRQRKDGRRIEISLTISPLRDAAGTIFGASKVARDIGAQKEAERALIDADRRKDEFLALLAHELRNPLGPIRHAVNIIRSQPATAAELEWAVNIIDRQTAHMTRLVDDLLDVSRITRGRIELRRERVDVGAVLRNAVEANRAMIEKSGHHLTMDLPLAEPLYVDGDAARLTQVFANLIDNAAKYTDPGGRITVGARRDGPTVTIGVTDSGIGIPAEEMPRVFEMFTQASQPLERSKGGLGVGLALVERLVRLHGGTVTARSEGPGKGSEFIVQLPNAGQRSPVAPERAVVERPALDHRCRILVVDDNHDAADSLAMLLRLSGHDVRTAHDGPEAVAALSAFQPDVALLDLGMPGMTGYELAGAIRRQPNGRDIVLVAVTGWGQEDYRHKSKEAGFDHHLTKPVEFDVLQAVLKQVTSCLPEGRLAAR
ncbi:MAG: PAS domain S-box protein [Gemmatimonadales bacterium]|nr:PAS domain S-box protein [Gemmatimonadales bacterium]